jgi:hypothetical protein
MTFTAWTRHHVHVVGMDLETEERIPLCNINGVVWYGYSPLSWVLSYHGKNLKCRPYLTQMPGGAGRMPVLFSIRWILLPEILRGT